MAAAGKARKSAAVPTASRPQSGAKPSSVAAAGGTRKSAAVPIAPPPQTGAKPSTLAAAGATGKSAAVPTAPPSQFSGQLISGRRSPEDDKYYVKKGGSKATTAKTSPKKVKGTNAQELLCFTVGHKDKHQAAGPGSTGRSDQGIAGRRAAGPAAGRASGPGKASSTHGPVMIADAKAKATKPHQTAAAGGAKGSAAVPSALQLPHGGRTPSIHQVAAAGGARGSAAVPLSPPSPPGGKQSSHHQIVAAGRARGSAAGPSALQLPHGGKTPSTTARGGARGSSAVPPSPLSSPGGKPLSTTARGGARGSSAVLPLLPSPPGGKPSSVGTVLKGLESLQKSAKPAIVSLSPWFGGYRLEVDNEGDCFGLSWMAAVLIWAAQSKNKVAWVAKQILDAGKPGGAFSRLDDCSKGHVAYLEWYVTRLKGAWENPPTTMSATEHGTSLAVGVVRNLHGSAESVDGVAPLRLKHGMIVAARAFDVFAAPTNMKPKDLVKLRTVGLSVEFDIGEEMVLHDTNSSGGGAAAVSLSDSVMRPARGLKLVVGMIIDSATRVGGSRRQIRQNFTRFFRDAAVRQPLVGGLAVLKGGLSHYDVLAAAGTPFGDALAREFELPNMSRATYDAALGVLERQASSQVQMTHEEVKSVNPEDTQLAADLEMQAEILQQIMAANAKQRASSSQGPG